MTEKERLLTMARAEYAKDDSITENDVQDLVEEMIYSRQIPKDGDRLHFHKTAFTLQNNNIYNHYKKKFKEFKEHCQLVTQGKTEINDTLYRGTNFKREFKIGKTKFTGLASWSRSLLVAEEFGSTVYILEGSKWATSLNEYSLFPTEQEFLVTSNIQVEVKGIDIQEEILFGRKIKKRYVTFEVVEDVNLRHSDTDSLSGYSDLDLDMEKRATFLADGPSAATDDDFEFHKYLMSVCKSKKVNQN